MLEPVRQVPLNLLVPFRVFALLPAHSYAPIGCKQGISVIPLVVKVIRLGQLAESPPGVILNTVLILRQLK